MPAWLARPLSFFSAAPKAAEHRRLPAGGSAAESLLGWVALVTRLNGPRAAACVAVTDPPAWADVFVGEPSAEQLRCICLPPCPEHPFRLRA